VSRLACQLPTIRELLNGLSSPRLLQSVGFVGVIFLTLLGYFGFREPTPKPSAVVNVRLADHSRLNGH
jgi:hypothetical protein